MPSAPQKRPAANGKSADTQITCVLSRPAACSLNLRTDVAHVPVSIEGKMLRITRLPLRSARVTSPKSAFTNVKSGACCPTSGSEPTVETELP